MSRETLALIVGQGSPQGGHAPDPRQLLRRAADEVMEFATPMDAVDGLLTRAESRRPSHRLLFLVDQRGLDDVRWRWLELLARLDLGPVILLVDEARKSWAADLRRAGVSRCFEARHLSRHPELLVQAARRALGARPRLAPAAGRG